MFTGSKLNTLKYWVGIIEAVWSTKRFYYLSHLQYSFQFDFGRRHWTKKRFTFWPVHKKIGESNMSENVSSND